MSPQPPKKNAPGIFEINSPALAWQNLFSPTLVRGTCFFRLPTIVLLAQADFLSVFEYIYRIPQYILLIRLITDQISICIYIYIPICNMPIYTKIQIYATQIQSWELWHGLIVVFILRFRMYWVTFSDHSLLNTNFSNFRVDPKEVWVITLGESTLGVLEIWNSYIGL